MKLKRKRLDGPSFGGLMATRQGAVTLAVICALAATGILVFALGKYRHAVSGATKQATVLVATSEIQKGSSATEIAAQKLYKVTPVLAGQVSPGAIVNAASLASKVAATNILPGQQLTASEFTIGPAGITAQLSPSERAVSVSVDAAHGAAGVLQAGDHVDVYGSFSGEAGGTDNVVSLVTANAVVLKTPGGASGSSGPTVLLGVSKNISPKLMWVFDYGKVWLELRGANSSPPAPTVTGVYDVLAGNSTTMRLHGVVGTLTYTSPSGVAGKP
ncbi:MAG TPA: Flp pilus assembly protein CpaB [Solirubrobacteraceae bacterium]|nr:Flp pilus assembly protein CpaB [Solirubrobacteraceae bacterium]